MACTFALFFSVATASAAPFPATSSSTINDVSKAGFFHGFGFRMQIMDSNWAPTPSATSETASETVRFEPKNGGGDSSVSIRMDRLSENSSLETYAKKWMRDYPSYGFEILGTKNMQIGGGRALLVDMLQKAKNRQLRQMILQRGNRVAILTCLDKKEKFNETLQTCNQMIRGFEWNDISRPVTKPSTTVVE